VSRRRRRPAYARALAQARDLGQHPRHVWVVYGDDWSRWRTAEPILCVKPPYRSHALDWHVVSGVPVRVVPRCTADAGPLLADIARVAAPVDLLPDGRRGAGITDVAFAARRGGCWPRWWSDALDADYRRRLADYLLAEARDLLPQELFDEESAA